MKEKKYYIQYKIVLILKKRLLQRAFHFKSDIILEC